MVEKERAGCNFADVQHLVSGQRGRKVYEDGDPNAGIWTCGIAVGLINDVPTCDELVQRIGREAEQHIARLATLSASRASSSDARQARL